MSSFQLLRSFRHVGVGVFARRAERPNAIMSLAVRQNHDATAFTQKIDSILGIKSKEPEPSIQKPNVKFTGFRTRHTDYGDVYSGNWQAGKYHGFGTMTYWKKPNSYVGKVKEVMSGSGSYVYEGNWHEHLRHGQGTLVYPNGSKFVGEFKEDKLFTGFGLMLLKKGAIYEGEVKDGKEHGEGKLTYADGQTLQGWFKDGKLFKGTGVVTAKDGTRSEGEFNFGVRHGECVVTYSDGRTLEGRFKYGKIHNGKGLVKLFDREAKKFTQELELEGIWEDGVLVSSK